MHLIDNNLFLGDAKDAVNITALKQHEITHILTVDITPVPSEVGKDFVTKFVEAEDCETVDILSKLEDCLDFIDNGTKDNGKILVHCHAGVSRSASFVAAFLMKKYRLPLLEAEERIRRQKTDIGINSGFAYQLLIFEAMGYKVDPNHPAFKKHKFRMLKQEIESGGYQGLSSRFIANNPQQSAISFQSGNWVFKCKKCRRPVFEQTNIYPHEIDETKAFQPKLSEINSSVKCSSLFLEPIKWMESSIISNLSGRLDCPHCSFRLGRFNWSGAPCSCGKWVTPAMQIHASNVDKTLSASKYPRSSYPRS